MAYKYEHDVISELEQMGVDYQSNGYFNMSIEVEEVYRKAKAMDEIEQAYWKSNTPDNFAYEFVGIFEKHFSNDENDEQERAVDET